MDLGDAQAALVAAQLGSARPEQLSRSTQDGRPDGPVTEFVTAADWGAVRESVPPTRHRGEQRDLSTSSDKEAGISQLRFDMRRGEVAPGQWVRELSVPVELVSKPGGVDAGVRRALARDMQRVLDERVNGRYRLPGGDQLHVVLDARTSEAPPRAGWERDGSRPVPVEVGTRAERGQLSWRAGDTDAAVGKLLRFVGVEERTSEPARLGGAAEGRSTRLDATDLARIEDALRDTAGDAREMPPQPDPTRPTVVAGPAGTVVWSERLSGLGTSWVRGEDGWYGAEGAGVVQSGDGPVVVPKGARAVFDAGGEARFVELGEGISVDRGLDGQWSPPRSRAGEVRAQKMTEAEVLEAGVMTLADGSRVMLPPESERVIDHHGGAEKVVAYRQLKDAEGNWLSKPRVFVPDGDGGWVQHTTDAVAYEGWLASANKASEAARTLWDIAARSGPEVPRHRRLTELSEAELKELYGRGPEADAFAAVFELIRRNKGIALRWTQVSAVHTFGEGRVVNMAAGEGKSWLFFAHAAVNAMRPGVDGVQVTTTRGILADRELPVYVDLLQRLGVDVHRLNQDDPPPGPREGRPTVYLGTAEDVGFTYLRHDTLPGQQAKDDPVLLTVSIDEIDEALVYSNAQYILSEGVQGVASPEVLEQVRTAHDLVRDAMGSGWLTEADFGRRDGQAGGQARLTGPGQEKVELLLGRTLSDDEVTRVNMAAAARWEYKENVHYVVHDGKIFIIDQTTHNVMFNPATSSESRWNGGLAQAVEFKHGLEIRSDSAGNKVVTAHELLGKKEYGQKTGASGTANGHGAKFAEQGMSSQVQDVSRYYEPRLKIADDVVAADEATKLRQLAEDVHAMQGPEGTRQPQLILATRNDQVAMVSDMLTELGVTHEAIDAKWQLEKDVDFDDEFKRVIDAAGAQGKVLVINMQGARGVDITTTKEAKDAGDLVVRITAHSEISRDIDIQAQNRAGRSGGGGEVVYYSSPKDELFQLSQNPDVQLAITHYTDAVTSGDALAITAAQQGLRDLVGGIQANSGHPTIDQHTAQPNAPPTSPGNRPTTLGDEPETPPPDEHQTDPGLVEALTAAQRTFNDQIGTWRAAHPDLVIPASVTARLNEDFLTDFYADYTIPTGSAGHDWRTLLDHTAAGLHDTFDQEATTRTDPTPTQTKPTQTKPTQTKLSWSIPTDREEALEWVAKGGDLPQRVFGKRPARDVEPYIEQATRIVSRYHRVPVWIENPAPEQADAVRENIEVKYLVAGYLANGLSEQDAEKLSEELSLALGTSRTSPHNTPATRGGAQDDQAALPVTGESSSGDGAARVSGPDSASGVPREVVGWRPAMDESEPQTLREFLVRRAIEQWWRTETPLRDLPAELLDMVWQQLKLDPAPVEWVQAWFDDIADERTPQGDYRYSDGDVAAMSDGLVDEGFVEASRGVARAEWKGLLDEYGRLTDSDNTVVRLMAFGFVDAVVRARPESLPRMRAEFFVAEGDPGVGAEALRSRVARLVRDRLGEYPDDAPEVSVEDLLARVAIGSLVVPAGDSRFATARVSVEGQRPPGGLYGPIAYDYPKNPEWLTDLDLQEARDGLEGLDRADRDWVFTRARELVNQYNYEPRRFDGPAPLIHQLYRGRYEAAVELVAGELHTFLNDTGDVEDAEDSADYLAKFMAPEVGWLRWSGVLSGEWEPLWPSIPSDREGALAWVHNNDGGLSPQAFEKRPEQEAQRSIEQATRIVSLHHQVPGRSEEPSREQAEAARVYDAVKDVVARYLAHGLSEKDAEKLSEELATKLGTLPASPGPASAPGQPLRSPGRGGMPALPGRAQDDVAPPKAGESSGSAARAGGPDSASGVPQDVVGWRPAVDESEPQTLREFLVRRAIAQWWRTGTPLRNLPAELLDMVWQQLELDPAPVEWVQAWFDDIADERTPQGDYRYSDGDVAAMSDGLIDRWVVEALRGVARAEWEGQLIESAMLTDPDNTVVRLMAFGFVDAAAVAPPESLPRMRAELLVAEGHLGTGAEALRSQVERAVRDRLEQYPEDVLAVLVRDLLARVDIESLVVPTGDPRMATVRVWVEGQRTAGGLYGPAVHDEADSGWLWSSQLSTARDGLEGLDRADRDRVVTRARELMNRYHHEPLRFDGTAPWIHDLHRGRYEAAVDMVAWRLQDSLDTGAAENNEAADRLADTKAFSLIGPVGWRRRHGVLGGEEQVERAPLWPSIPSDAVGARAWVANGGGLSGKRPAHDVQRYVQQATKIVSRYYKAPLWIEKPAPGQVEDAVRLNGAVKDLVAEYLANGLSEQDAERLSEELATKLGTLRTSPRNTTVLPGSARNNDDAPPKAGESSRSGAWDVSELDEGWLREGAGDVGVDGALDEPVVAPKARAGDPALPEAVGKLRAGKVYPAAVKETWFAVLPLSEDSKNELVELKEKFAAQVKEAVEQKREMPDVRLHIYRKANRPASKNDADFLRLENALREAAGAASP
ncbi:hypothetical protein, partial [Amycolatopsis decaplanina]|uniref:preprotein translocase subunit SecA n=1 Tax=Amycolatopsis decaplanina TaxID=208441 RepID=UPI0012695097